MVAELRRLVDVYRNHRNPWVHIGHAINLDRDAVCKKWHRLKAAEGRPRHRKFWSQEELDQLRYLRDQGLEFNEIDIRLGRPIGASIKRWRFMQETPDEREKRLTYQRNNMRMYYSRRSVLPADPEMERRLTDAKTRDDRYRDLTGWMLGDPPIGRSALDKIKKCGRLNPKEAGP